MVSKTRKKKKSRKSGRLDPEQDRFELDEISQVIGSVENSLSSEDEGDTGQLDQVATSTSRLYESDMLSKLSEQVDAKIQEGLSQSLSQLEKRLKVALESLHETFACSVGTRSHHSGEAHGEYSGSILQSAPVDMPTYSAAL